jgi:hypothetical protein
MAQLSVIELAARVNQILTDNGELPLVIGAAALAAHGYVRATEDFDLGVAVHPRRLAELAAILAERLDDAEVTVELPQGDDPLGGVIDILRGDEGEDHVQVVNFDNAPAGGFPAVIRNARSLPFTFSEGVTGQVIAAEDLVLLKLYAGGSKSLLDIQELLVRRQLDRERLEELARRYGMERELRQVLGPLAGC